MKDKGYNCYIFEKNAEFKEVGAAISIFPNALSVYQKLGILEEVVSSSGEIKQIYFKNHTGKILKKLNLQYELPAICIHRAELHAILRKHTAAEQYTNCELQSFSNLTNGKVEVTFTNGTTKIFDAVIGADGIHSAIRKLIVNDGKPVFRGYNVWRGVCQFDLNNDYASETYGKGKRVGIVPIKDGIVGWWATYNEPFMKDDEPEGTKQKLQRLFGDWHYPIPDMMVNTSVILKNSVADRVLVKGWTKGAVTLLGDAAHPTTPNLGQGACMAIEGGYILANTIEKYGLNDKAFAQYEALQYIRAKSVVNTSLQIGKMGQAENPFFIFLRNTFISLMPTKLSLKMNDKFSLYDVTKLEI